MTRQHTKPTLEELAAHIAIELLTKFAITYPISGEMAPAEYLAEVIEAAIVDAGKVYQGEDIGNG